MKIIKIKILFTILLLISACSSIPKNTSNSCSIFNERYLWFKHAIKSENSKPLTGINIFNISKIIESKTKYKFKTFKLFEFL